MSFLEFLTGTERQEHDAPRVVLSASGQLSVDFADVIKTTQFQRDLEAIRTIAASAAKA